MPLLIMNIDAHTSQREAFILGGGLIALGIIKSLSRRSVRIKIFDFCDDDIAYRSRFVRAIPLDRSAGDAAAIEVLVDEAQKLEQRPVLMISGDMALRLACSFQERLSDFMDFVLPSLDSAKTVLEKSRFADFAERMDVPVPRTWSPSTSAELLECLSEVPEDALIKPRRSTDWHCEKFTARRGHIKAVRVSDKSQLLREWTELCALSDPPLIQEYVKGRDSDHFSYVSYIGRGGKELGSYCIQKLRLNPIHGGLATFATAVDSLDMAKLGRDTLTKLGYRGAASVCFKRDPETGIAKIFEINGRLPLAHQASAFAGLDMPWLMYLDAIGASPAAAGGPRTGYWLSLTHDMWAATQYRRAGELSFRQWLRTLFKVRIIVEFDPRDLGPFLYWFKGFCAALWARVANGN